jgi:deoxyhypusine synthase
MDVPFLCCTADSEFGFIHWLHSWQQNRENVPVRGRFKEVPDICVSAGSQPNAWWSLAEGFRYTVAVCCVGFKMGWITLGYNFGSTGNGWLSGSTLKETISWGEVKDGADNVMLSVKLLCFSLMAAICAGPVMCHVSAYATKQTWRLET